jgi:bifunctional DNA-binding transcriptional regulator/antitoxin component of YhaV-PrlF toxin-antitoxin module
VNVIIIVLSDYMETKEYLQLKKEQDLSFYVRCLKQQLWLCNLQQAKILKLAGKAHKINDMRMYFSYLEGYNRLHASVISLYCEIRDCS